MRHRPLAALALFAMVAAVVSASWAPTTGADTATERLVVTFRPGTSTPAQESVADSAGDIVQAVPQLRTRTIEVPAARADMIRKHLLGRKDVALVEPDVEVTATAIVIPDDPWWSGQWGPQKVQLPTAWGTTTGASDVTIAIVDTGVTFGNADLTSSRRVTGRNFVVGASSSASDDNGHGTAAAGVAAMLGNNDWSGAGACWSCKIMPVKVLNSKGSGSGSNVSAGIVWAADHGADVISLSLGGGGTTDMKNAVTYAESKGIPVVAAAGNNNNTAFSYPGAYAESISVGATDQNDVRTYYSTYGSWVKVAAPGTNTSIARTGSSSVSFSGTSSATPLVSGIVALMRTVNPSLTPANIRLILKRTADPAAIPLAPGSGRVNAAAAIADAATFTEGSDGTTTTSSSTTSSSTTTTATSGEETTTTTGPEETTTTSSTTTTTTTAPPAGISTTATGGGFSFSGAWSRSLVVKAGPVRASATCSSSCTSLRIDIYNSSNVRVATVSGKSSATVNATLPAGTYTFKFTGPGWKTLNYSITYLR